MAERTKLEMAQAWADIVIDRWRKRMAELEVNDTGALLKSFEAQVAVDAKETPRRSPSPSCTTADSLIWVSDAASPWETFRMPPER